MGALFLAAYLLIAVGCVALGWYLSEPGRTVFTLPGDVLSLFHDQSQPSPHDEPAMPVDEHAETQYHLVTPVMTPTNDEGHESHEEAAPTDAVSKIIDGTLQSKFFTEQQSEAEPVEAVHDEP